MTGNINAIGIIVTVLFTIFVLWKFGSKAAGVIQVIVAVILPSILFLIGKVLSLHECDAGNAFTQLLIPAICLAFIITFVRNGKVRILTGIIIFIVAVVLTNQFNDLVHGDNYTGNQNRENGFNILKQERDLKLIKEIFNKEGETAQNKYPPDWLLGRVLYSFIPEEVKARLEKYSNGVGTYKLWHTCFTGLYGIRKGKGVAIWYPGGLLKDCANKLELKEIRILPILREFKVLESGIAGREYCLCATQKEIDNFLQRNQGELKHLLPISDTPKISSNEMCIFVCWGGAEDFGLYVQSVIEEQDRVIFRVSVPIPQSYIEIEKDEKTGEEKVIKASERPKYVTPFGYFIIPRINKKIVIQNDPCPYENGVPNWQDVKEFNLR